MTDQSDTSSLEELGYATALAELEQILSELEASDVDVDQLADRVARATDADRRVPPAHRSGAYADRRSDRRPRRPRGAD